MHVLQILYNNLMTFKTLSSILHSIAKKKIALMINEIKGHLRIFDFAQRISVIPKEVNNDDDDDHKSRGEFIEL